MRHPLWSGPLVSVSLRWLEVVEVFASRQVSSSQERLPARLPNGDAHNWLSARS